VIWALIGVFFFSGILSVMYFATVAAIYIPIIICSAVCGHGYSWAYMKINTNAAKPRAAIVPRHQAFGWCLGSRLCGFNFCPPCFLSSCNPGSASGTHFTFIPRLTRYRTAKDGIHLCRRNCHLTAPHYQEHPAYAVVHSSQSPCRKRCPAKRRRVARGMQWP
jgi:hypothetical protein